MEMAPYYGQSRGQQRWGLAQLPMASMVLSMLVDEASGMIYVSVVMFPVRIPCGNCLFSLPFSVTPPTYQNGQAEWMRSGRNGIIIHPDFG